MTTAKSGHSNHVWRRADVGRLPGAFIPELFSAPALAKVGERQRLDELVAVPYVDGLMAGEPDALVESFASEPELYDPVRGRVIVAAIKPECDPTDVSRRRHLQRVGSLVAQPQKWPRPRSRARCG